MQKTIELGTKARDAISGFEGTVTGHVRYLSGEDRLELTSPNLNDGHVVTEWFDLSRVEPV